VVFMDHHHTRHRRQRASLMYGAHVNPYSRCMHKSFL
jgi:hypothetical protein